MGFGSTQGPPMLPALYNNHKRIVQTDAHVMILVEMNHDARVIRLNSEHDDPSVREWLGDSIGWWEGDTLVVSTKNFGDRPGLGSASRDLHVTERFTRLHADTLHYEFTVEDPSTWTRPRLRLDVIGAANRCWPLARLFAEGTVAPGPSHTGCAGVLAGPPGGAAER